MRISTAGSRRGPGNLSGRFERPGRVRQIRLVLCLALVAAGLAACGGPSPTVTPGPTGPSSPPTACVGLTAAQCDQALAAVAANLPGESFSYVSASRKLCDGPCPGSDRGVWLGGLFVDFADGRKSLNFHLEVDGQAVTWEPVESALVEVAPRSARLTAPTTEFTIGHCGIGSGIDVDGSFWDPVGMIDIDAPDLINSAKARFSLSSPDSAILVTEGGLVLHLVRHPGSKWMFLCD